MNHRSRSVRRSRQSREAMRVSALRARVAQDLVDAARPADPGFIRTIVNAGVAARRRPPLEALADHWLANHRNETVPRNVTRNPRFDSPVPDHEVASDHNGEPVCACGWDPARRGAPGRMEALSMVRRHILDPEPVEPAVTYGDVFEAAWRARMSDSAPVVSGSGSEKSDPVPVSASDVAFTAGSVAPDSSPVARLASLAQVASPEGDYAWQTFAASAPKTPWLAFKLGLDAAARWEARS